MTLYPLTITISFVFCGTSEHKCCFMIILLTLPSAQTSRIQVMWTIVWRFEMPAFKSTRARLMNLSSGLDSERGFSVVNYSPEIELEVDGIFQQMYDEQITIDDVIAMLQRYKNSSNSRDREILSCMLHFLFDEYKFFQTWYPSRTSDERVFVGSIIQHELVDYIPLGIAIHFVIDATNCPSETNLFNFGLQALSRFEPRLCESGQLCQDLPDIPHLLDARPDLPPSGSSGVHCQ